MRLSRFVPAFGVLSAAVVAACGLGPTSEAQSGSVTQAVSIPKAYTRKIYVHMMPWFNVGGQHWSMNSRNSATGIASWYAPMIGEYNSNDRNVIEYQLLMMKYAGIDGVLVDWPGLAGTPRDLPGNRANADAIINQTVAFGLEFGIVYEDQYAASVNAAMTDLAYVRDNYFNRANYVQVDGVPVLMDFGPQNRPGARVLTSADWTNILSVFPTSPMFFSIWYNTIAGASNADGAFAWIDDKGLKSVSDFDNVLDGVNQGLRIPVLYPGFNTYYAQGGWPGPTFKVSYTLKPDNTEGGNTLQSGFMLGQYAGPFLQVATWNDYGEGTMIEPTNQFQYQSLTTLQQAVGTPYTDAELKIVKMLFDQRRGGGDQARLNQASTALANLDFATACSILGCTVPVHVPTSGGGAPGVGGSPGAGGMPGSGGSPPGGGGSATAGSAGSTGAGGGTGAGGMSNAAGGAGTGNPAAGGAGMGNPAAGGAGNPGSGEGKPDTGGAAPSGSGDTGGGSGSCSMSALGADRAPRASGLLFAAASVLGLASLRRRKRAQRR